MATTTPQAMPVGTILQMNRSFYEVIRATVKTIWAQELQTETRRDIGGNWFTLPIRGVYASDKKLMRRPSFIEGSIWFDNDRAYIYEGGVLNPPGCAR
jgi:hypothetical protein